MDGNPAHGRVGMKTEEKVCRRILGWRSPWVLDGFSF